MGLGLHHLALVTKKRRPFDRPELGLGQASWRGNEGRLLWPPAPNTWIVHQCNTPKIGVCHRPLIGIKRGGIRTRNCYKYAYLSLWLVKDMYRSVRCAYSAKQYGCSRWVHINNTLRFSNLQEGDIVDCFERVHKPLYYLPSPEMPVRNENTSRGW